jgi:hypothetical protein
MGESLCEKWDGSGLAKRDKWRGKIVAWELDHDIWETSYNE